MSIEVYFNKPARPLPVDKIVADQLGYDGDSWWECKECARKNKHLPSEGRHE